MTCVVASFAVAVVLKLGKFWVTFSRGANVESLARGWKPIGGPVVSAQPCIDIVLSEQEMV